MAEQKRRPDPAEIQEMSQLTTQSATEMANSVAALRTESDRVRSIFGFGRRILVPADEIHVVVGDGRHISRIGAESKVFGQTADQPARYWLNPLTQVVKLKTISFTVPIRGNGGRGVEALDSSQVSFKIWAHAVAKLDPKKATTAAQRIGIDTQGLINTITRVSEAALSAASAKMSLKSVIEDRQKLAAEAFDQVNTVLSELGYDLALLTITQLDGTAYRKLVMQSEARVSKETSIATNREQVAEDEDDKIRQQRELENTKNLRIVELENEKLLKDRENQERLSEISRQNDERLAEIRRAQSEREAQRMAERQDAETAAENTRLEQALADKNRAERIDREQQILLDQTEAEARRKAIEQQRGIERAQERTVAEAERLQKEERERAERTRAVALIEAEQLAQNLKLEASAEAEALSVRTQAESQAKRTRAEADARAEQVRAEAEANAAEKLASAAKTRADATRAETAAPGLAKVEVDEARLRVAELEVSVQRAEGLAQAEIATAQATAEADKLQKLKEVEIAAQRELATLYEQAPVLIEMEKLRMTHAHEINLETIRNDTRLRVFEALAPSMKIHVYGNGGQMGEIMNNVMAFTHGVQTIGDEVPMIGRLVNGNGAETLDQAALLEKFGALLPSVRSLVSGMNPRVMSTLKVNDVLSQLDQVVSGDASLTEALSNLRADTSVRMLGDMPIRPMLGLLGVGGDDSSADAVDAIVDVEAEAS